jgi:hypothetical protein
VCFNNYYRSGNQDAENKYDEWVKFSLTFTGDVITYAISIFTEADLNTIGRALPQEAAKDTGTIDPNFAETRASNAAARKRQRAEQRQRIREAANPAGDNENSSGNTGGSPLTTDSVSHGNSSSLNLSNIVHRSMEAYNNSQIKLTALNLILTHGAPNQKADAMIQLNEILNSVPATWPSIDIMSKLVQVSTLVVPFN